MIELPRNLDEHRITVSPKAIPTWSVEEAKRAVDAATGQLRLHLMLMINCGMTHIDISDLQDPEVDWESGRITRKRSKERNEKNVPTVQYLIWPQTLDLLRRYRSGGKTVLLTESGKRWVRKEIVGGRLVKSNNINSNYAHLKRKLSFRKPLKELRKTSTPF